MTKHISYEQICDKIKELSKRSSLNKSEEKILKQYLKEKERLDKKAYKRLSKQFIYSALFIYGEVSSMVEQRIVAPYIGVQFPYLTPSKDISI